MPKVQTAKELQAAIERLEASLPAMVAAVTSAEAMVSDAYAEGAAPDAALDQLSRAKAAREGALRALGDLDSRWYAQAQQEHEVGEAKVQEKIDALLARFESEVRDFFEKKIASILGPDAAQRMAAAVVALVDEPLADRRIELSRDCPPCPTTPRPRNAQGRPKTNAELDAEYKPSGLWSGPVHVAPARKERDPADWLRAARS